MNALLRLPSVLQATGYSRATLYAHIKQRLMTAPVKLGERCAAWPSSEVASLIDARIAGKSHDEIRTLVAKLESARAALT